VRNAYPWKTLTPFRLFGAEGDEADPAAPQVGDEPDGEQAEDHPQTFDAEYVEKLRKENAERRVAAKEAEAKATAAEQELAKIKRAEMDDIERMKVELAEKEAALEAATGEATSIRSQLQTERILNAVTMAATEAGFQDPADALTMISQDDIVDDDGNVDTKAVARKLKTLSDKKPYLLKKTGPGSGDGGSGGKGAIPDDGSFKGKVDKYRQQMIDSGRVPA